MFMWHNWSGPAIFPYLSSVLKIKLCLRKWFGMHCNQSLTTLFGLGQPIRMFLYHFQQTFNAIVWQEYLCNNRRIKSSQKMRLIFIPFRTEPKRFGFNSIWMNEKLKLIKLDRIQKKIQETTNKTIQRGGRCWRSTKNTIKLEVDLQEWQKKPGPLSVGLHLEQNSSSFEY